MIKYRIMGCKESRPMVHPLDLTELAKNAEINMMNALKSSPGLMEWFKGYNPDSYAFNGHHNLHKLAILVDEDGHSGASFALCCRAVKNKL